jgi:hypothetical protein
MATSKVPTIAHLKEDEVDAFLTKVNQRVAELSIKANLTNDTLLIFFNSIPERGSSFETWYAKHKATLIADATAHFQNAAAGAGAAPAAAAALTPQQLHEYYEHLVTQQFAPGASRANIAKFERAVQGTDSPSVFKDTLLGYHKKLGGRISEYQVADQFMKGLHAKVREHVQRTLMGIDSSQWFARLAQTATEADQVWKNLSLDELTTSSGPTSSKKSSQRSDQPKAKKEGSQRKAFYFEKHKFNFTHDTANCRQLQAEAAASRAAHGSSMMVNGPVTQGRWVKDLAAVISEAVAVASGSGSPKGGAPKPQGYGGRGQQAWAGRGIPRAAPTGPGW